MAGEAHGVVAPLAAREALRIPRTKDARVVDGIDGLGFLRAADRDTGCRREDKANEGGDGPARQQRGRGPAHGRFPVLRGDFWESRDWGGGWSLFR